MKRFIAVFLILSLTLVLVGCGKNNQAPATTTPYTASNANNNFDNNYYNENTYIDNTYTTMGVYSTEPLTQAGTQNVPTTIENNINNATQDEPQAPSSPASNAITPDSIESGNGIQKATYNTSSRMYIVYYPSDLLSHNATFPIISWANGTACPPSLYDGLLREIAAAGFIVVASDETMAADGTAQIEAIDFVISENSNKASALCNKVNKSKIGVIGHSQGGRSAVNAGAADNRITCVISLAGSNYVQEAQKLSKPVLFMAGTKDKVVDANKWLVTAYNAVSGPAVYASLNGAIHTTCCSDPTAYSAYVIDWFNAWFYDDGNLKAMFKDGGKLSTDSNWSGFMCKGL